MEAAFVRLGLVWLLAALVLSACSSAPPPPDGVQDRKNRAADYLKFGRQAFQEAQYDQALSFYQIAVDLDTAVDSEAGMAAAWNSVASAQTALGKTDDARASLALAESYAALSGDKVLVLQVAVNLVQADLAAGNKASARQRLTALQPFPETAEGAALEHAWGALLKDEGNSADALAAFDRALTTNQKLGLKQEMASNRFMKASVLAKQGHDDAAKTELEGALVLDRLMENTIGIGQDWRALGTLAVRRGDNKAAFDAYVRASRLFEAAHLPDQQRRTVVLLIPVAVALGLADEAARYKAVLDRLTASP
jgi:tetratricopeptide (TPR) repeat protein